MAQYPQGIFQSLQYLLKKVKILALDKQPTYSISVASANYTIVGRGIYYISGTTTNSLIFPDPALMSGQSITIINNGSGNATFSNTNGFAPKSVAGVAISLIATGSAFQLVSINNSWISI